MYGKLPTVIGTDFHIDSGEFLYYQYMPIKLFGETKIIVEPRLKSFNEIIGITCCDYVGRNGLTAFVNSYVYLTAKRIVQVPGCYVNRPGWHTDGFLTDDINYIWSDSLPTIFNTTRFVLSADDVASQEEMEQQADPANNVVYPNHALLRLDKCVVHRCDDTPITVTRTFLKLSFSKDKYDLKGNTHNYLLNYDWHMRDRNSTRNVPQELGG